MRTRRTQPSADNARRVLPCVLLMLLFGNSNAQSQPAFSVTVSSPINITNHGSDGDSTYTAVSTTTDGTLTTTTRTNVEAATGQPVVTTVTTPNNADQPVVLAPRQVLRADFEDTVPGTLGVALVAADPTAAVLDQQAVQAARSGR